MRSARIVASQGRKLPKTSRVPVLSVESTGSQNYRHSLVQAGISPLARFDEEETESDTSNDCTSTYDENYNSYARDELIRPNDDYRQLLHMRQLMAIRKLINDSESKLESKPEGSHEVYPIGERTDTLSKRTQNYQNNSTKFLGSQKKIYLREQRIRHPKHEGTYISSDSSSSSESINVSELESFPVKVSGGCRRKLVPPPISKLEKRTGRRIQPLEVKKEIRRSVPDTDETCKRRFVKENGKLVLRTATQPPHNRTIATNRLVSLQPSNTMHQAKACLRDSNQQTLTQTPKVKTVTNTPSKPPLKPLKGLCSQRHNSVLCNSSALVVKNLPPEKPNFSNPQSNSLQSKDLPPSAIIVNKKKDTVPTDEISRPKVSEAIKLFERNAAEETSETKSVLKPIMRLTNKTEVVRRFSCYGGQTTQSVQAENIPSSKLLLANEHERLPIYPTTRCPFQEKEPPLWQGNNFVSSYETTQAISSQEEHPNCSNERRPAGAVAMYSNQGPQLLREMKDRFRTKYGISYSEPKPSIQEPLSSSLLQDTSVLSGLDLSLEEVQHLAPLPTNLGSDFSHILPSVLKERPRRAGRPPTVRTNPAYSKGPNSTTDV